MRDTKKKRFCEKERMLTDVPNTATFNFKSAKSRAQMGKWV